MAKLVGPVQIEGSVGTLSIYKTQDGYLIRQKSGVSGKRIKNSPAFARTRENIAEFTRAAQASKLFRSAFSSLVRCASDNRVTSRLTGMFLKIVKQDPIHSRGERIVSDGEPQLLEGFELNKNASLGKALRQTFTTSVDRVTGRIVIDIPAFSPADKIIAPNGATHFRLFCAGGVINFKGNTFDVATSESMALALGNETEAVQLVQNIKPNSEGVLFVLLGIEFLQSVNWEVNVMKNAQFNALGVVRVER